MGLRLVGAGPFSVLGPAATVSGAQCRLKHLGFYRGVIDGKLGPRTHEAIRALQRDEGIEPTAELDPETLDKIRDRSGGV